MLGFMMRRKLIINVIIIFVCGAVALSLPVFVKHWRSAPTATASDNNNNHRLVGKFVGNSQTIGDWYLVWQISLESHDTVIATWDDIYQNILQNPNSVIYNTESLKLTSYGFICRDLSVYEYLDIIDYSYQVTYKGYTCTLRLP